MPGLGPKPRIQDEKKFPRLFGTRNDLLAFRSVGEVDQHQSLRTNAFDATDSFSTQEGSGP